VTQHSNQPLTEIEMLQSGYHFRL